MIAGRLRRFANGAVVVSVFLLAGGSAISAQDDGAARASARAYSALSAGDKYTCGLSAGRAWCWGAGYDGQLGTGETSVTCHDRVISTGACARVPVNVAGNHTFVVISAARDHACAIDDAGDAWCWGDNDKAQLGDAGMFDGCSITLSGEQLPAMPCSRTPVKVPGNITFTTIAAGQYGTCALDESGHAWCWGFTGNEDGPIEVPLDGHRLATLSMGEDRACGLTADRRALCWDWPEVREKGYTTPNDTLQWLSIAVAKAHGCGLDAYGQARCWGDDADGALGIAATDHQKFKQIPLTAVVGGHLFRSIAVSTTRTCAIDLDGALYCWGYVPEGQQRDKCLNSNGDDSDMQHCSGKPVLVNAGTSFRSIALGETHRCAIATTGISYCWGTNDWGELGDGTTSASNRMTAVVSEAPASSRLLFVSGRDRVKWFFAHGGARWLLALAVLGVLAFFVVQWWKRGEPVSATATTFASRAWEPASHEGARKAGIASIVAVLLGWVVLGLAFASISGQHGHDDVALGLAMYAIFVALVIAFACALVGAVVSAVALRRHRTVTVARTGLTLAGVTLVTIAAFVLYVLH